MTRSAVGQESEPLLQGGGWLITVSSRATRKHGVGRIVHEDSES